MEYKMYRDIKSASLTKLRDFSLWMYTVYGVSLGSQFDFIAGPFKVLMVVSLGKLLNEALLLVNIIIFF